MIVSIAGLGRGGQQLQACRKSYIQSIELLVALANLQTAFVTLDEALKVTDWKGPRGAMRFRARSSVVEFVFHVSSS